MLEPNSKETPLFRIPLLILALSITNISLGEEAREIPLKDVWAHDMPGTKDIDLEPDVFGAPTANLSSQEWKQRSSKSLLSKSLRPLADLPEREAAQGFAVNGNKLDALKGTHAILAKDATPTNTFSPQDEISIVFFSHRNNALVQIEGVKRNGSDIEIQYKFVPRFEALQTVNLALIPLGTLPPGTFNVKMIALPIEQEFIDLGIEPISPEHAARVVCRPFRFEVESDQ